MSVEELSRLHKSYIELSDRFKAAWTFHQFLQGLKKVFPSAEVGEKNLSFQGVYGELKAVSQSLSTAATERLKRELTNIERDLATRVDVLLKEDSRVSPSLLRQFFGRVKSYDEKILLQLLRFYLFTQQGREWEKDRVDKADFLLTKLGEEIRELRVDPIERDPTRLRDVLNSLWALLGKEVPAGSAVDDACKEIESLRSRVGSVDNLDELNQHDLVGEYRSLKHRLGGLLFEPRIAHSVLETNLYFREIIQKMYEHEERRIAAEYQEVFELERGAPSLDSDLDDDLKEFHNEIERFERHLEFKNVRLDELAYIRQRVRNLIPRLRKTGAIIMEPQEAPPPMPRRASTAGSSTGQNERFELPRIEPPPTTSTPELQGAAASAGQVLSAVATEVEGQVKRKPSESLRIRTAHAEIIGDQLRRILKVLEGTDWQASPKAVAATPEVQGLRLLAREIVAYRRLHEPESCNRELEQFLLETAAVRLRISSEAEEIVGIVDQGGERGGEVFAQARETTRVADQFQHRFAHFIMSALQEGQFTEAQTLQFHRMRLLRDYSGLWLLAFA